MQILISVGGVLADAVHSPEGPRWEEAQGVLLPWATPHTDQLPYQLLNKETVQN